MDFASADTAPEALEPESGSVGFRPVDADSLDLPPALRATRQSLSYEVEQTAPAGNDAHLARPAGWPIWLAAVAVAGLWASAPIAFALGYRSGLAPFGYEPFALAVFALMAVGPAAFVMFAAWLARQAQLLAHEARRERAAAEDLLAPTLIAAARAGDVTHMVRDEIARAGAAADEARDTLMALRDALAFETDKLTGATAQSVRTAGELASTLGRERAEMGALAQTLDAQATRLSDAVTQQARMVAEATGLAETQIREAETALGARAAELAAAAGEASGAARTAGEDLTRHIARLETAGTGVAEQILSLEAGLSGQRSALTALTQALKGDQAGFAAEAEAHAARLGGFIEDARTAAGEMSERAAAGGEHLRRMMSDAALQFRDLAETARAEREEFSQSTLQSLEAVSTAAARERAELESQARAAIDALAHAAEETREAAARHAAAAREQVDTLSEAAFGAGQKANQVFEARLEEARALIEASSRMVEEAGAATARKLADGAVAARAAMNDLSAMLVEIEHKTASLPDIAVDQAGRVRAAIADSLDELMDQARRTADQAQAIDAAFQERVRRNFEMLSEAVRLMGAAAAPGGAPTLSAGGGQPEASTEPAPTPPRRRMAQPAETQVLGADLADGLGLRNRIRFTPTATDREFSAVFEAASGGTAPAGPPPDGEESAERDPWSWKDLLASLDGEDDSEGGLESQILSDLGDMGVDPVRLLPSGRVAECAVQLADGAWEAAKATVRKAAPAATRRIGRRLQTDEAVKARADLFTRRYLALVDEAAARGGDQAVLGLLDTPGGKLFLLLEATSETLP
ncbi:polar localization protein TipN [Phenylobacterium sp.]|uniref:polar localization protein TipN n=1 Tax=Phenylobacterium sp. TaxID=1871053 RepID=UPI00301DABA5